MTFVEKLRIVVSKCVNEIDARIGKDYAEIILATMENRNIDKWQQEIAKLNKWKIFLLLNEERAFDGIREDVIDKMLSEEYSLVSNVLIR